MADFRNCLYFGTLDFKGKEDVNVNISTCDDIGEYAIVVEGVYELGKVHKCITTFEVK